MISKIVALLILLVLFPILSVIATIIIIDDGFPVLFSQKRIGANNTKFSIFKFRTMKNNLPDIPSHRVKNPSEMYTNMGPLLRKLSLDELPQLINIIKGDMKFVGPRPALYNQNDLIKLRIEAKVDRLIPGITGWAQVNGRDELSIIKKVKYDKYYLENKSLLLNLKILLLTVIKVISAKSVSH